MILIDYSAVALANVFSQPGNMSHDILRHMVLNSIRSYRKKYKNKYGEIVICCDSGNWRKEVFPQYKANRHKDRDESEIDWDAIWGFVEDVKTELKENFPYKIIQVRGCEADDVIAALTETTQEFGQHENVMIISGDKDFHQLQKYSNVGQYSPITKKEIKVKNPGDVLFEHICRGDGGDGVPNIMSHDDTFVNGDRQKSLATKKLENWKKYYNGSADSLKSVMTEDEHRNFIRNKTMIDLTQTPKALVNEVINTYENQTPVSKGKIMPFLIKNRCRVLLESLSDFVD